MDGTASSKRDIKNHVLFEIATEVANRGKQVPEPVMLPPFTNPYFPVGGIYSVLKSKAPVTTAEYGERYTLIGPLNRASVSMQHDPPNTSKKCSSKLFSRPLSRSSL